MSIAIVQQKNSGSFNVKDFGAVGNGVTDDTLAIQAAINKAAGGVIDGTNTTGGLVFFPPTPGNTYLHHGLILYSFVHLRGCGLNATTLLLENGANADSIQGYNAPALIGGNTSGGIVNWSIQEMTIDGNKSNQSGTSYGIRQYGYGFILQNIIVRNTLSDIIRSDWNGGSASANDSMEAKVINCKFHDAGAGAIGMNWTGPHDSVWHGIEVYKTGSHAFYIGPNATGMLPSCCHGYNMQTGVSAITWLVEGTGFAAIDCIAEGSDTVDVVCLANNFSWQGGSIFCFNTGVPINNVVGLQIGQAAGQTPYTGSSFQSAGVTTAVSPSSYMVHTLFSKCEHANGTVWFANDGGNGFVSGPVVLETNANPNKVMTGALNASTYTLLFPIGVTADGTVGKGGWFHLGIAANQAMTITDQTQDIFNFNTSGKRFELVNGAYLEMYADNYSTQGLLLYKNTVCFGQSATASAIANAGTITATGVGAARVAPTGNVTGIILQAGAVAGQTIRVINESSFTLTLNTTPGTSNVADSATEPVIAALTARSYIWNSITGLWYRIA